MRKLILFVALLLAVGCNNNANQVKQKFLKCKPGMTLAEVESILGPPYSTTEMPTGHLKSKAKTHTMSIWALDDGAVGIMMNFEDGKLTSRIFTADGKMLMPDLDR